MRSQDPDVLKCLRALAPTTVYTLAPKDSVVRGYDYYSRERLEGYEWRKDGVLVAWVRGTKLYAINVSSEHGLPRYICDCPAWTPTGQCKHVVCVLLTTINLLNPETFRIPGHDPIRLGGLKADLLANSRGERQIPRRIKSRKDFELVISLKDRWPKLYVRKQGLTLRSAWHVPPELVPFMSHSYFVYAAGSQQLSDYLPQFGHVHLLTLETAEGNVPLRWDSSLDYQPKTQLNVEAEQVIVTALCLLKGAVRERVLPLWNFIVDVEAGVIAPLKNQQGWELYRRLAAMAEQLRGIGNSQEMVGQWADYDPFTPVWEEEYGLRGSSLGSEQRFTLSLERFQAIPLTLPAHHTEQKLEEVLFTVQGRATTVWREDRLPDLPPPRYRLSIDFQAQSPRRAAGLAPAYALRAECWWGNERDPPTMSTFQFFPVLEHNRTLPSPLKARKRKAVLYDTFFQCMNVQRRSEADRIITEALASQDFAQRPIKTAARALLHHYSATLLAPEPRLVFSQGRWVVRPTDPSGEALLYRIPYEIFGQQAFQGMSRHDEMVLPGDLLFERLPQLHAKLAKAGIELAYRHRPILTAAWDFSFDARRTDGIDWFEIRPEITVDGQRLDPTIWEEALKRGGVVEMDGALQILDARSQDVLQSLALIYGSKRKGKREHRGVVRVPRLQVLDWIALRRRGARVRLSPEDDALIDRLTRLEKLDMPPLPARLHATLRPYQREGYAWLAFLYQNRFGACLADDMGLGKTLQAISLLGGIHEGILKLPRPIHAPHLIVLPPSLLFNWEQEFSRFYPDLRLRFYTGKDRSMDFSECDVVLTTYGLVRRDRERLAKCPFHVIVFDEAQTVKNIFAETTGAVRQLTGYFKLVMTGTPLENHVGEYYSLIDLCLPGLLGAYEEFKPQIHGASPPVLDLLLHRTKPFVLRRTKEKLLKELPPKTETDVYLELTSRQKALYRQTVAQIKPAIDQAYREKTQAQARIIALTAILRLRQLCVSPRLLKAPPTEPSPKIEFVVERVKELMEVGHSALVFSQFTSSLDLVEEAMQEARIPFSRLDGSTPTGKRKQLVKGFQESERASVFLLSLKAGGQGLNLTKASYVFHLDPWWNPAVETQASDRAHRIGQTQHVSIIRILMRHTIEEKMMELKAKKLALYRAIVEASAERGSGIHISKRDFDFLLEAAP